MHAMTKMADLAERAPQLTMLAKLAIFTTPTAVLG